MSPRPAARGPVERRCPVGMPGAHGSRVLCQQGPQPRLVVEGTGRKDVVVGPVREQYLGDLPPPVSPESRVCGPAGAPYRRFPFSRTSNTLAAPWASSSSVSAGWPNMATMCSSDRCPDVRPLCGGSIPTCAASARPASKIMRNLSIPLLSMRCAPGRFMNGAKAVPLGTRTARRSQPGTGPPRAHLIRLPGADRSRQGHRTGPLDDGGVLVQECFHPPEVLPPVPVFVQRRRLDKRLLRRRQIRPASAGTSPICRIRPKSKPDSSVTPILPAGRPFLLDGPRPARPAPTATSDSTPRPPQVPQPSVPVLTAAASPRTACRKSAMLML